MRSQTCPGCGRMISIHRKRWQRHYTTPEKEVLCEFSEQLAVSIVVDDASDLTEADWQTWMRL